MPDRSPPAEQQQNKAVALRTAALLALLSVIWLLWSGHYQPLMIGFGVLSCLAVVAVARRMAIVDADGFPFERIPALLRYLPWLLWQIVVANLQVAKLVLSRRMPLNSQLIHMDVSQRTAFGKVVHANTITITPGTITLNIDKDTFLIHALTDEAAAEDVAGEIDRRVKLMEDRTR